MLVLDCGVQVSKRLQDISVGSEIILAQLDYTTPQGRAYMEVSPRLGNSSAKGGSFCYRKRAGFEGDH